MIRRPPRSTLDRSSAASDVYKRQVAAAIEQDAHLLRAELLYGHVERDVEVLGRGLQPVSYTHLRAHETVLDLVCRLLLEQKKHMPVKDDKIETLSSRRQRNHSTTWHYTLK